ncbi:CAP domain-containing protein [Streptosporangium fragile]
MGLFACLMSVLLIGFIIGRNTRNEDPAEQIYLNNAGPASPTPTAVRGDKVAERSPLARVAHPSATPTTRQERQTPSPTPEPSDADDRWLDDGPSRYVINGDDDGGVAFALGAMESEVVRLVNIERRRARCAPLRVDRRLTRSARAHSSEMADTGKFSHTSPDGKSPWERMEAAGYGNGGAENIGRGYTSAEQAVRSWMETTGHRRNILNCELKATGVGVVQGPEGPWWTQDFGYS